MVTSPDKADETEQGRVEIVYRTVIAGDSRGAVRRIILYTIALVGLFLCTMLDLPWSGLVAVPSLVALVLLGMTDNFV